MTAPVGRYVMVGGQFTSTLNTPMSIQDFVKGDFTAVDYDEDFSVWQLHSPVVLLHDGEYYTTYYYQTDCQGTGESPDGWVDGQAEYADVTIKAGQGFWFADFNENDGETCTVTFAGQVPQTGYQIKTSGTGYCMIANPFPVAIPLNSGKISWEGIVAIDYDEDFSLWQLTSPVVLTHDGEYYTTYYYQTDCGGTGDSPDGWVDGQAEYADVELGVTQGCWFRNPAGNPVTITFEW